MRNEWSECSHKLRKKEHQEIGATKQSWSYTAKRTRYRLKRAMGSDYRARKTMFENSWVHALSD